MRSLFASGLLLLGFVLAGVVSLTGHPRRFLQLAAEFVMLAAQPVHFRLRVGLEALDALALLLAIHVVALHQHFEVNARGVELGPIDAGELALVVDQHTTTSAHAGAVDHDRVEADNGLDLLQSGQVGDGAHHGHRADGEHVVDFLRRHDFLELVGDQTLMAVTAIVGHNVGLVADRANLVFQHHQVFAAGANDGNDVVAGALQLPRCGIGHCRADAAADDHRSAEVFDLRGFAQRANDVEDFVAGLQHAQQHGGFPDGLYNDGDRAGFGVGVSDGQRDALTAIVQAHDHKLSGLLFASDARGLDYKQLDVSRQRARFHDVVHSTPPS